MPVVKQSSNPQAIPQYSGYTIRYQQCKKPPNRTAEQKKKNHICKCRVQSEQNLPTMLPLKAQFLQIPMPRHVAALPLVVFFLLQLEDFGEGGLLDGCGDFVFAIEVLVQLIGDARAGRQGTRGG